jgi:hypothetical protein
MLVVCAVAAYILIRRKDFVLRLLDAEESFWLRLGFSKRFARFGRGFAESRFYTISFVVFTLVYLLLAVVCACFYFYLRHRLHR